MKIKFYLFVLCVILLYSLSLTGNLSTGDDDANYIVLSKALATGQGYRLISHPHQPLDTLRPPMLPFLLMPMVKLFPQHYLIYKLIPLFFSIASIFVFAGIARLLFPEEENRARWLVVFAAISPIVTYYSTQILSECIYYFFSLLTIYLALQFDKKDDRRIMLGIAFASVAAYYSRIIGISLLLSVLLLYLIRKRYKLLLALAFLMIILILPWFVRSSAYGGSGYTGAFFLVDQYDLDLGTINILGLVERFFMNSIRYAGKVIPDLIFYPWLSKINPYNPFKIALGLLLSLVIVLGFYRNIRTRLNLLNLYAAIYFIFCLLWPIYDVRFLMPILPLLLLFLMQGVREIARFIKTKHLKSIPYRSSIQRILITLFVLFFLAGDARIVYSSRWQGPSQEWKDYHQACLWLRDNTEESSNVMCRKPYYSYLMSGRKTVLYPFTTDPAKMNQFIIEHHIDYIIFDRLIVAVDSADRYLKPFLITNAQTYRPVFKTGSSGTCVYKRITAEE